MLSIVWTDDPKRYQQFYRPWAGFKSREIFVMKKLGFVCLLTAMVACGPRPFSNLHMVSLPETNGGQALPLHIIPVDATLLIKVTSMSPEDWFVSDVVMTTSGIHKRVFSGGGSRLRQCR